MSKINDLFELRKQMKWEDEFDYDMQAAPRFWVIMDYKWEAVWEDHAEKSMVYVPEYAESYDISDLLESEKEDGELPQVAIEDMENIVCDITALEWVQEWIDEDAYLVPVALKEFIVPDTLFLTKQDAKRHLEVNHYHYTSKAHTYAMTAWRSKSMRVLWDALMDDDTVIGKFE